MFLSFCHAKHKGSIGHIGIHLLNDNSFGAFPFILVCTLRAHLVFPLLFLFHIDAVAFTYVAHNAVYRTSNAALSRSRSSHKHVHERSFMLHVINVFKSCVPQVGCKGWKHSVSHSRLVDVGCFRNKQPNHCGQGLWHVWRKCTVSAAVNAFHLFFIFLLLFLLSCLHSFNCLLHYLRHVNSHGTVASTLYG